MNTQPEMTTRAPEDDKSKITHVEADDQHDMSKPVMGENIDEFGAAAKTDPKEIALVRKLDWFMMVRLALFLGYRRSRTLL